MNNRSLFKNDDRHFVLNGEIETEYPKYSAAADKLHKVFEKTLDVHAISNNA